MAFPVFSWFIFYHLINNKKGSYYPWKEAMNPVVSLKTWDLFPCRPCTLTRQDIWTEIFIITIAKRFGFILTFLKMCTEKVHSPKGQ